MIRRALSKRDWEADEAGYGQPAGENLWYIEGEIDLDRWQGGPLIAITEIGS